MIRTQIQLTEKQTQLLKELASQENVSMAELIRQAVDYWLQSVKPLTRAEQRRRALEIVGQFRSGQTDISERHDEYLVEAYSQW